MERVYHPGLQDHPGYGGSHRLEPGLSTVRSIIFSCPDRGTTVGKYEFAGVAD